MQTYEQIAHTRGWNAKVAGKSKGDNPFPNREKIAHEAWRKGYTAAEHASEQRQADEEG